MSHQENSPCLMTSGKQCTCMAAYSQIKYHHTHVQQLVLDKIVLTQTAKNASSTHRMWLGHDNIYIHSILGQYATLKTWLL